MEQEVYIQWYWSNTRLYFIRYCKNDVAYYIESCSSVAIGTNLLWSMNIIFHFCPWIPLNATLDILRIAYFDSPTNRCTVFRLQWWWNGLKSSFTQNEIKNDFKYWLSQSFWWILFWMTNCFSIDLTTLNIPGGYTDNSPSTYSPILHSPAHP